MLPQVQLVVLSDIPESIFEPYLWAYNTSFRLLVADWVNRQTLTVDIYEVGSTLARVESFHIHLGRENPQPWTLGGESSFSPITYHWSVQMVGSDQLLIFDIQKQECLSNQHGSYKFHCFSPGGNLFAASLEGYINIWKCNSGSYTL